MPEEALTSFIVSDAYRYSLRVSHMGWPKKVSHYRESSLNRIKNCQPG